MSCLQDGCGRQHHERSKRPLPVPEISSGGCKFLRRFLTAPCDRSCNERTIGRWAFRRKGDRAPHAVVGNWGARSMLSRINLTPEPVRKK
jgi:hypothetical protein